MNSDPFAPAAAETPGRDPYLGMTTDGWLAIAFAMLLVPAALSGMLALLTGMVGITALFVPIPTEPGDPPMSVIGLMECAILLVPTALYGGAAMGIFTRQKWGWVLGLIGFGLWLSGCCAPLALAGFYALLREDGRKAFGM